MWEAGDASVEGASHTDHGTRPDGSTQGDGTAPTSGTSPERKRARESEASERQVLTCACDDAVGHCLDLKHAPYVSFRVNIGLVQE